MTPLLNTRRRKRKFFIFVMAAIFLAALAWYVDSYGSLETLAAQEIRMRNLITANPWDAFFTGFGIYLALALVPGTGGKAIVYGWLFGFWQALTIVTVGLTIAAMAIFSLSRYLFRESIERRYSALLLLLNKHLEKKGAFYLLTMRMAHVPYSIVNPVSGASRVRTWTFFWTTAVGLIPANAIWTYLGTRLPSLHELAASGAAALIDPPLIAALVACAALPLVVRWLISRFGIPAKNKQDRAATTSEPNRKYL